MGSRKKSTSRLTPTPRPAITLPLRGPAPESPRAQLARFIARFTPEIASLARGAIAEMTRRLPGAIVFVYDNYQALVVGFGPTERPSDAIFSVVIFPKKVALCFLQGARIPDPKKRLRGSGNVVRSVLIEDRQTLAEPEVVELIGVALACAKVPLDPRAKGRLWIKSISKKQRPRRP